MAKVKDMWRATIDFIDIFKWRPIVMGLIGAAIPIAALGPGVDSPSGWIAVGIAASMIGSLGFVYGFLS